MAERRSKYGSVQTIGHDGATVYDSRLEADVARVLEMLKRQGRILDYARQVPYELAPACKEKSQRAVRYICDFLVFLYAYGQGKRRTILLEARGHEPASSRLKRRWFTEKYPDVPLRVVHAPEEVIAVIEDIERAGAGKESSNAPHTDTA